MTFVRKTSSGFDPSSCAAAAGICRSWHGEAPLWRVYWLYGVLGSAVLAAVLAASLMLDLIAIEQIALIALALYTAWIVVAVWRCAPNVADPSMGHLARALTVAWAINAVMVLGFLQLGLIGTYLG